MSVAVRKSSPAVIRPPEPPLKSTTTMMRGTIKLTSFDMVFHKIPSTALLVFEHLGYKAIESIKRALSEALVLYYPLAGRIIPSSGADGEGFSISCTGEGVEFITASVDRDLHEAKIFGDPTAAKALLDELATFYPPGSYGSSDDPLLSMQMTEFSCGGLVLGVTWNHAVADGAGIFQFLVAVGELARGLPSPSVVLPTRSDEAVSSFQSPFPDPIQQVMLMCPDDTTDMDLIVPLDVTVPSALINRVKAESRGYFGGQPCTTFEVVLAVLWRCRVRATMSNDPVSPVYLTFTINARKRVGAKDGYYGNCIAVEQVGGVASGVVAEASIMDLVKMIKRAKDKMGNGSGGDQLKKRELRRRYDLTHATSLRNIGLEKVDFGSGAPARVMSHMGYGVLPMPVCVIYPPCKGKDGVNLQSHYVKEEHADAFLGELAKLEHVET